MKYVKRAYQESAIADTILALEQHKKVGAILPTGAGKSFIFIGVAVDFLAKNPGKSVLVLSHLSLLTVQTGAAFKRFAPHIKTGVFQADKMPANDCHVFLSTVQSSRVEDKTSWFTNKIDSDVGLIIIDECHYLGSDSYDKALGYYPDAKIFGVTATPFRERRIMTSAFEKISFTISLQELINDGYLVEPKLHQIIHQSETVDDLIALMVKTYQEKEKGNKAIVFMQTIEDAKALRNAFVDNHIKAEAVTSEMIGENRDDVLNRFNTGDIDILTTVNVLTAGFDAPNVRAIFMPYATSSPTMYMQRIGRGLRPFEGKTECRVYVVGDAPSISKQTYEKIHRDALNGTADWKSYDTLNDDLAFNFPDKTSEVYLWTVQAVEIAQRLENLGLRSISKMLVEKKFPKKFMGNLVEISKALEHVAPTAQQFKTPYITAAQAERLQTYGFPREGIDKLTKTEGSMLIAAMIHMFQEKGPYVVQSGQHAGKHVAKIPHQYKMIVLQKFPNSNIAKLIRQWNQEKRA